MSKTFIISGGGTGTLALKLDLTKLPGGFLRVKPVLGSQGLDSLAGTDSSPNQPSIGRVQSKGMRCGNFLPHHRPLDVPAQSEPHHKHPNNAKDVTCRGNNGHS